LSIGEQVTHVVWGRTAFSSSLRGVPSVGERFDVVDQAEERPLPIDLGSPAQREPIQPRVVPHVRTDRLDGREALRVVRATRRSIPAVIALDSDYVERSWWGPRPAALHRWVLGEGQAVFLLDDTNVGAVVHVSGASSAATARSAVVRGTS
jgi:hypothetical protein